MASNPFDRKRRAHERTLSRLEREFDRGSEPLRQRMTALHDVEQLRREGIIDRVHADMFIEGIEAKYKIAEGKRKYAIELRKARASVGPLTVKLFLSAIVTGVIITLLLLNALFG